MNVKPLFKLMVEKNASDLFFAPFTPAKMLCFAAAEMPLLRSASSSWG